MGWNREERENFERLEKKFRSLQNHTKNLEGALKEIVTATKKVQEDNNFLRSQINVIHYKRDSLEQYGRRKSLRIHQVVEKEDEDVFKHLINSANFVLSQIEEGDPFEEFKNRKVEVSDIQRCHRIGNLTRATKNNKARPIIAKFKDYRLRMAILLNKKKLEKNQKFKKQGRFFTEDLTPFKNKLLWYTKKKVLDTDGKNMFVDVHSRDGKIKAKKATNRSAKEWVTITSPDDFHRHDHDVVIDELNKYFNQFQILKSVEYDLSHIDSIIGAYDYE